MENAGSASPCQSDDAWQLGPLDVSQPIQCVTVTPEAASSSGQFEATVPCPDLSKGDLDVSTRCVLEALDVTTDSVMPRRRMQRPTQVVANDLRSFGHGSGGAAA